MKITLGAFTLMAALTTSVFGASKTHIAAPPAQVFQAALRVAQLKGCVGSSDEKAMAINFAIGRSGGFAQTTPDGNGSVFVVDIGGHGLLSNPNKAERAFLRDLDTALSGKQMEADRKHVQGCRKKLDEQAVKAAQMNEHERKAAALRVPPASAVIYAPLEQVKSALISESSSRGFSISSETEHQLTISREANRAQDGSWLAGKILFGNYTVESYVANVQFMLATVSGGIQISSLSRVFARNGFGAVKQFDVSDDPQTQSAIQGLLDAAKKRAENSL